VRPMRSKIAVVGEKESVLGFKAVGFAVFETSAPQETEETIHRLAKEGYGIIFITEQALAPVLQVMDDYKDQKTPAIIPIPGRQGTIGLGMTSVKKSVERAVGADILFKD
jgi:V/A-type H+-transporting ATPase subunit F